MEEEGAISQPSPPLCAQSNEVQHSSESEEGKLAVRHVEMGAWRDNWSAPPQLQG